MADTEVKPEKTEEKTEEKENETETDTKKSNAFISGTGRRKTAVARVFLKEDKGEFIVNGKDITEYFPSEAAQQKWIRPFHTIGVSHPKAKFSATIKVSGSGNTGQLDAVVHGLARALAKISTEYHEILAKQGFMTRDPRMVERKKYYLHKARKRPQYSKR
jgi:small subunit ribosomal protein S9